MAVRQNRRRFNYGSIYLRKGTWTIDYKNEVGKRIQRAVKTAVTPEDALYALQQEIGNVFQAEHGVKPRKEIGFREFAGIFLRDSMAVSRRNYRPDVCRLETLKGFFKDVDLRRISPLMIERFRKSRLQTGNAGSTTNRYLALLKRLFTIAAQEGYAEENPVKKLKLFSEKDTLMERILSPEEETRLLNQSCEHLRSILTVALNTGMRLGEILSLTWDRVDLAERMIRVEKTKSGRLRYIPVNNILFHELEALKSRNGESLHLFSNPKTGKPFTTIRKAFLGACRRAGITGLRIHDTRHSFATRLVGRGSDISTLQSLLGHSSISTTQRYLHSSDERKRQLVELLENKKTRDPVVTMTKAAGATD